ncbi:hypothetical protein QE152_g239 [Popillia japonica]|uniref:Uncharacterized protein n=1 Tax=Popillia japonica TaxID=7064 RepID=A0AAW1NKC9_POPJA
MRILETTSETLRVAAETGSPSVSSLFPPSSIKEPEKGGRGLLKNQKREVGEITPYMPNVPTPLPLNTVNHIAEIELFLSNEEAFSALSSYLASLGGRNVTTRTNRILREF